MKSSDIKKQARSALKGRWGVAILAFLVATLLGGTSAFIASFSFNFNVEFDTSSAPDAEVDGGASTSIDLAELLENANVPESAIGIIVATVALVVLIAVICVMIYSVARFIIGSIVNVGYSRFNINVIDANETKFVQIFSYFKHWWRAVLANFLRQLFIFLWSLLFIVPGIIAAYKYSLVPYILAENPDMSPKDAISISKELMDGNKWRLFCLNFSFIGWDILCALTFGALNVWVGPYKNAALAAFYRSIVPANREDDAGGEFI